MPNLSDQEFDRLIADLHAQLAAPVNRPVLPQWAGECDDETDAQAAREAASARMLRAVRPDVGRREGYLTAIPEKMVMDLVTLPARFGQAVTDYSNEEFPAQSGIRSISTDYDPRRAAAGLAMESALTAVTGGMPFAKAGALGSSGGKGIKGSLGQNYQPPLGAQPALTTPEALNKSANVGGGLSSDVVGNFLKYNGYEVLKRESSKFSNDRFGPSMSEYLTLKTPSGETVQFRLSDHADPTGDRLGARRGSSPTHTLANISDALGIPLTPEMSAAKSLARKSFLENAIPQLESRMSAGRSFNYKGDKEELKRMRQELDSIGDSK